MSYNRISELLKKYQADSIPNETNCSGAVTEDLKTPEGKAVGYLTYEEEDGVVTVKEIFVKESYRGHKIAKKAVDSLIKPGIQTLVIENIQETGFSFWGAAGIPTKGGKLVIDCN